MFWFSKHLLRKISLVSRGLTTNQRCSKLTFVDGIGRQVHFAAFIANKSGHGGVGMKSELTPAKISRCAISGDGLQVGDITLGIRATLCSVPM
jgi:hypothetical protein